MTPLINKMLVGGLLAAAAVVWAPKLPGLDFFQSDSSDPAPIPASSFDDGLGLDDEPASEATNEGRLSPAALDAVFSFLEERAEPRESAPLREPRGERVLPLGLTPIASQPESPEDELAATPDGAEPEPSPQVSEPDPAQFLAPLDELRTFLEANPLQAVAVGAERTSALFGSFTARPGDWIAGRSVQVVDIDREGVTLRTELGDYRLVTRRRGGDLYAIEAEGE